MQWEPLPNERLTALAYAAARLPYCPILFVLPVMQKKIAVQKGSVWGSHSSARPATHGFRLRKQAASVKHK